MFQSNRFLCIMLLTNMATELNFPGNGKGGLKAKNS